MGNIATGTLDVSVWVPIVWTQSFLISTTPPSDRAFLAPSSMAFVTSLAPPRSLPLHHHRLLRLLLSTNLPLRPCSVFKPRNVVAVPAINLRPLSSTHATPMTSSQMISIPSPARVFADAESVPHVRMPLSDAESAGS